ncbi:PadR family transcriptional regulator [Listeria monocytogenes]|nr:PadR family transcriptional regulator [Listeria monocytogenes]
MTSLIVLGLLIRNGSQSGYDIQVAMESSQTDTWAYVKPASIYYALKKLEEKQYVILKGVEKTGHRSKAIYEITPEGIEHYKQLIANCLEQPSVVFPSQLYSAVTFIDDISADVIIEKVEKQYKEIEKLYNNMQEVKKLKTNIDEYPENVKIIFDNIFEQCKIQLSILTSIKNYAEKKIIDNY